MTVGIARLTLYIPDSHSLKEKRMFVRSGLALVTAAVASEPLTGAAPAHAIAADASLRDALALMFSAGVDALTVVAPGGGTVGILTMARIRSHTRTGDDAKH